MKTMLILLALAVTSAVAQLDTGCQSGLQSGWQSGYQPGWQAGYQPGSHSGSMLGWQSGYQPGWQAGYQPGSMLGWQSGSMQGWQSGYQPFQQPFLQHPLNPCKVFLQQQCIPLATPPFVRPHMLDQGTCQVMRQQCCMQLAQIPTQARCPAILSLAQTIIPQLQQQVGQGFFQPQLQQGCQPQQFGQFQAITSIALRTIPAMCNVYVPPYCTSGTTSMGGY